MLQVSNSESSYSLEENKIPTEKTSSDRDNTWSPLESDFQRCAIEEDDRAEFSLSFSNSSEEFCDVQNQEQETSGIGSGPSEKLRCPAEDISVENVQTCRIDLLACSRLMKRDPTPDVEDENTSDGSLKTDSHQIVSEKTQGAQQNDEKLKKKLSESRAPHLAEALYDNIEDDEESIWSVCTDHIWYTSDKANASVTHRGPRAARKKNFSAAYCNKPTEGLEDVRYEDMKISLEEDKFNLERNVSMTYLGSTKNATVEETSDNYVPTASFPLTRTTKTRMEFPGLTGVSANTLIDSGATKSIISAGFLKKHPETNSYPRYQVPARKLIVGSGKHIMINECIKITGSIEGHNFEIIAIIIPIYNDKVLDVIIGAKSLFEIQANIDYKTLKLTFPATTIGIRLKTPMTIPAHTEIDVEYRIDKIPPNFSEGKVIAKMNTDRKDGLHQTVLMDVKYDKKKQRFQVHGRIRNNTKEMKQLSTKSMGGIDLRSMGYMKIDQPTLQRILTDDVSFLSEEDTTCFLHEAFMRNELVGGHSQNEVKKEDDPYPWLAEDDERRTWTDEEIMRKHVDLSKSALNPKEKEKFIKVLMKNKDVFSLRDEIGVCPDLKIDLEVNDKTPFFIRPYAIKEEHKKLVDKEMRKGCLLGILKRGMSSYSSPVMLIPRKNQKKLRIITDFRVLNSRLVKLNPSIPLMRDAIQMLGSSDCEVLSVIDLRDAYHTLRLRQGSKKYCGVTPYMGSPTYIYQRLGMGLTVSPAIWQNFIDTVLDELPNRQHHLAIMDDCLIHSKRKIHTEELVYLFEALRKYGLKISPKKCQFWCVTLTYMGHTIMILDNRPHITAHTSHTDGIRKLNAPKTKRQVKSFLGMVNFLAVYLKDLQTTLIPLYEVTRKNKDFHWGKAQQDAFEKVKSELIKPPILAMPNKTGLFTVDSDTSKIGCGATLSQLQNGKMQIVAFYSKKLPEPCSRYGITELELYGLTCNIVAFKHVLLHVYFEVFTDHSAIKFLVNAKKEPGTPRIQRLLEVLSRYNFGVGYKPGKQMILADYFSRHPHNDTDPEGRIVPVVFDELPLEHQLNIIDEAYEEHRYMTRSKARSTSPTPSTQGGARPKELQVALKRLPEPVQEPKVMSKARTITPAVPRYIPITLENRELTPPPTHRPRKRKTRIHAKTLDDILNPMPVDITLTGVLPGIDITADLPTMTLPPALSERQNQQLTTKTPVEIIRRSLPRQTDLKPLLQEIGRTVMHSYSLPITMQELKAAYPKSPYFKDIYKYIMRGYSPFTGKADTSFKKECAEYTVMDGVLLRIIHRSSDSTDIDLVLCIPEEYIPLILYQYHDLVLAAHQGVVRTFATVRQKYFFPRMMHYIQRYIEACHKCQEVKSHSARNPTKSWIKIPQNYRPFDVCAVDVKHMPMSSDGFKFLLLCVCEYTNAVEFACLADEQAKTLFAAIFAKIICRYGQPRVFVSDKHPSFISTLAQYFYKKLRIRPYVVSPHNKGSNKSERYIQTIAKEITKYLEAEGCEWPLYVAPCVFAFNTFVSPLTGISPYKMVFGRDNPSLSEIQTELDKHEIPSDQYAAQIEKQLQKLNAVQSTSKLRTQEDKYWREQRKVTDPSCYAKGDLVMLKRPALGDLTTGTHKFVKPWIGPFKISSVLSPDRLVISDWDGRVQAVISSKHELKPYILQVTNQKLTSEVIDDIKSSSELLKLLKTARLTQNGTDAECKTQELKGKS